MKTQAPVHHWGVIVRYCGHRAAFIADVYHINGAVCVRANGPVEAVLDRSGVLYKNATHHLSDFPHAGFWRPDLGVFVVPAEQFKTT